MSREETVVTSVQEKLMNIENMWIVKIKDSMGIERSRGGTQGVKEGERVITLTNPLPVDDDLGQRLVLAEFVANGLLHMQFC